jgi:hypothetical protein
MKFVQDYQRVWAAFEMHTFKGRQIAPETCEQDVLRKGENIIYLKHRFSGDRSYPIKRPRLLSRPNSGDVDDEAL